jgi:hypothetical protein
MLFGRYWNDPVSTLTTFRNLRHDTRNEWRMTTAAVQKEKA